jgi:lipoprotein-anchoring transpeptidase ErfK/SrfK
MGLVGKFHRWFDWTLGCIAVQNAEIDELYDAVTVGTPIVIYP